MDVAGLNVVLGAKVAGLQAGMQKAQQELISTSNAAQKLDSSLDAATKGMDKISAKASYVAKSFEEVSKEVFAGANAFDAKWNKIIAEAGNEASNTAKKIFTLSDAVAKFGGGVQKFTSPLAVANSALTKNTKASSEATLALTNLGRVAQDLPFGFIGIANNLNPLLESFQRLRATSGSNAAALKALGSSLTGAGGLGLALSAVTAALQLAQLGMSAWTRGFGSSKSAIDANNDSLVYAKSVLSDYEKELQKVAQTASVEATKVSILFSAIGSANTSLKERKELITQLIEVSPRYFQGLEKEKTSYDEIRKSVSLYTAELANVSRIKALLPEAEKIFKKIIDAQIEIQKINETAGSLIGLSEEDAAAETKRLQDFIRGRTAELVNAKKFLTQLAGGEDLLSEILFGKPDKKDPKGKVEKLIRQVFPEGKLTFIPFPLKIPVTVEPELKEKGSLNVISNTFRQDLIDRLQKSFGDINIKLPINFQGFSNDEIKELTSQATKILENFQGSIAETVQSGISSIFTAIGESIGSGEGLFSSLANILGGLFKSLGKTMIEFGIQAAILQKVLRSPTNPLSPVLSIAAGIALTALGAKIQSSLPHLASGGIVPSGFPNDSFPAMLQSNEAVIPLDKLRDFIPGGGQQIFIPSLRISNNELVIAFNQANKRYKQKY